VWSSGNIALIETGGAGKGFAAGLIDRPPIYSLFI
jgi:hypothetical protein